MTNTHPHASMTAVQFLTSRGCDIKGHAEKHTIVLFALASNYIMPTAKEPQEQSNCSINVDRDNTSVIDTVRADYRYACEQLTALNAISDLTNEVIEQNFQNGPKDHENESSFRRYSS